MDYLVYQELAVQVLSKAVRDGDFPFIMGECDEEILELWCAVAGLEVSVLQKRARDYWRRKRSPKMMATLDTIRPA